MTRHTLIHKLFEKQVNQNPNNIAIGYGKFKVSYMELNKKANQIANLLKSNNIRPRETIAIQMEDPFNYIASIIAILKLNAVYLPIASTYPEGYVSNILKVSESKYLLTDHIDSNNLEYNTRVIFLNNISCQDESYSNYEEIDIDEPISIFYESNSTGSQEGVVLSHYAILDWIKFNIEKLKVNFNKSIYIYSSRMMTNFPIWLSNLITGGQVYFYERNSSKDFSELMELINDNQFTSIVCSLHLINELKSQNKYKKIFLDSIDNIVSLGEETFDLMDFKKLIKDKKIRWHNYYGFPEITMITTVVKDDLRNDIKFKHIGKFSPNSNAYILGKSKQLVPTNLTGDLYAYGNGVMSKYHNNETINHLRFSKIPHIIKEKIYKTGYEACWLQDWKISIVGRSDDIVSIKGFRISLKEIEAALLRHEHVRDCSVIVRKTKENISRLAAFLVLQNETSFEEIDSFIKDFLPQEIFPIGYIELAKLPRTNDGLIDKKSLEVVDFFDSIQNEDLERKIKKNPQIEHVGILTKEEVKKPEPLHIKDYLMSIRGNITNEQKKYEKISHKQIQKKDIDIEKRKPALIHGKTLKREKEDPKTLSDILKRASKESGKQEITCIHSDETIHSISYSKLLENAERILLGIKKLGLKPGDKAILHFNKRQDYFCAFWGCTLAGVIPIPISVPKAYSKSNNETKALYNIWEMLDEPIVLTTRNLNNSINELFDDFQLANIEDLKNNEREKNWHEPNPDDIAVILFTSGSTGKPKGVMQSHKNILAREKSTIEFYNLTKEEVSLNWLTVEHVVGLLMFHIKEIYLGCKQIHVSTDYILGEPLKWLDMLTKYEATMTWAPNFAFGLVNEAIEKFGTRSWELSALKLISNCGETVNGETSKKFLRLLAPFNLPQTAMKPEWGMSETCSCVLGSKDFTSDADNVSYVDLGTPYPGISFRVIDSDNKVSSQGEIGRLQVKGVTVTPGYYNNTEINKQVFVGDGWFDTGDLAVINNDRVTLTGRVKDVIIINGINYNNNEIEATIEELKDIEKSYTVACAVRDEENGGEKLAIFFNSKLKNFSDILKLIKEVRQIVTQRIGITPDYIIPVDKNEIPKTSIGKLQRSKLMKKFELGDYEELVKKIDIGFGNQNTVPAWFFNKDWKCRTVYSVSKQICGNNCLVFEDELELSEELIKGLKKNSCECILIKSGSFFNKISDDCYEINYEKLEDYIKLFQSLSKDNIQINDIFHLNPYGKLIDEEINIESIRDIQAKGLYSLFYLIKSINNNTHSMRLFVVSSNSQFVLADDEVDYQKGGYGGFLRTISLELPWLQCCHIDLEIGSIEKNVENILKEWKNPKLDYEIAYRNGCRFIPLVSRLKAKEQAQNNIPIQRGGIYLITGGLGGIGTYVSKWLIENFQAKLIIIGRSKLPDRNEWENKLKGTEPISKRINNYLDIESIDNDFIYEAGDICDESFLNDVAKKAQLRWEKSISGVFHLAGIGNLEQHWKQIDKHWIMSEKIDTFEDMFKAKVYGTIQLHKLVKDIPDAMFVAFSSVIGSFGSSTLSAYAAANSFLDSFCSYRRSKGFLNTFCLSWSSWDNTGMSENISMQMSKSKGFEVISPKQGIISLLIALRCKPGHILVGLDDCSNAIKEYIDEDSINKQVLSIFYSIKDETDFSDTDFRNSISNYLSLNNIVFEIFKVDSMPLNKGKVDFEKLLILNTNTYGRREKDDMPQTELEKKLYELWKEILGISDFGVNDSFFDIGGHSLKATTFISRTHRECDVKLTLSELFDYPTIKKLSDYINTLRKVTFIPIEKAENKEKYDLSPAQNRLYIINQLNKKSLAYNMTSVNILKGKVDREKLENTFKRLIDRHESLRMSFELIGAEPFQIINEEIDFKIKYYEGMEDKIEGFIKEFVKPFDLAKAPLLRVGLIRINKDKHILIVDIHHIIADGISSFVLLQDMISIYNDAELSILKFQYKDFSQWQNKLINSDIIKKQEAYWLQKFTGDIPLLNIPTDYQRLDIRNSEGEDIYFTIENELYQQTKNLMKETGTTLYMLLLAIGYVLMSKYTKQEDIIIGSPVSGRNHADLQNITGMFVGQLAIRSYPSEQKTFREFLYEVKANVIEAHENQDYQFNKLVKKLGLQGNYSRHPLFDIVFAVEDRFDKIKITSDLELIPYEYSNKTSKTDLRFGIIEKSNEVDIKLTYSTALFKRNTCEKMGQRFLHILDQAANKQDYKLKDIALYQELMSTKQSSIMEREGDFIFESVEFIE